MSTRRQLLGGAVAAAVRPSAERRVRQIVPGLATTEGAGVQLMRIIGQPALRSLDPFVLLDRIHTDDPEAYRRGFPDHPHRGFETVTVMLEGRMRHRDSRGNEGVISGGGVQWMTAGRGIVHSEMPEQDRGFLSGYQFWINLPAREKLRTPEYQDLPADRLAHTALPGRGHLDLVAGRALGRRGPVAKRTTEPLLLVATFEDDRPLDLEVPAGHNAFVVVHVGSLLVSDHDRVEAGSIAVLDAGTRVRLRADRVRTVVLVAAGKPLGEPVVQSGPFVMNTEAEIRKAWDDYRSGTLVR